ncbi:hypothetical protein [Streptomyces sp. NPDC058751]|uniref:hypothetical protein n=1 Tax=Streptomyces sp. NPDC058751 TaxID=3346623 RepID=UPI00368AF452
MFSRGGRRRAVFALPLLLMAGLLTATATAAPAEAAPVRSHGYVHADKPDAPEGESYAPRRSVNSAGGENKVVRAGTGEYWVFMAELGTRRDSNRGVAHVTAHGTSNAYCSIRYISRYSAEAAPEAWTGVWLSLRCFTPEGALTDSEFTASWANAETAEGHSGFAYLTTSQLNSHMPPAEQRYNSSGYGIKVVHLAPGSYEVQLIGQGGGAYDPEAELGHVQVTAAQAAFGAERCTVGGIESAYEPARVKVYCHDVGGAPRDTLFSLTFARKASLVRTPLGMYTRARGTDYEEPDRQWTWDALGEPTAVSGGSGSEEGRYWVKTPMSEYFREGNVQVTAEGSDGRYCKVAQWSAEEALEVRCFNGKGDPTRSPFLVSYAY